MKRKLFVASSLSVLGLTGCGSVGNAITEGPMHKVLPGAEAVSHALIGTHGLARTYADSEVSSEYRIDSLATPADSAYAQDARNGFRSFRLVVDGLVDRPQRLDINTLRGMPLQTQITRHDCVEGWSVIGKWRGVRLSDVLARAQPKIGARYVVFHCLDHDEQGTQYYESLDLHQAAHPQALLCLDLNDRPVAPDHGAPVRLRVPTQLGYKSAKWVSRIELASTYSALGTGKGGYWEDQGYEWFAGI